MECELEKRIGSSIRGNSSEDHDKRGKYVILSDPGATT